MDKCGQIVDKRLRFCQNSHLGVPTSQTGNIDIGVVTSNGRATTSIAEILETRFESW